MKRQDFDKAQFFYFDTCFKQQRDASCELILFYSLQANESENLRLFTLPDRIHSYTKSCEQKNFILFYSIHANKSAENLRLFQFTRPNTFIYKKSRAVYRLSYVTTDKLYSLLISLQSNMVYSNSTHECSSLT